MRVFRACANWNIKVERIVSLHAIGVADVDPLLSFYVFQVLSVIARHYVCSSPKQIKKSIKSYYYVWLNGRLL